MIIISIFFLTAVLLGMIAIALQTGHSEKYEVTICEDTVL